MPKRVLAWFSAPRGCRGRPPPVRGFSLVEVLIAAVILVAVMVPLLSLLFGSRSGAEEEVMMTEAIGLASNVMDQLVSEAVPFDAIDPAGGSGLVTALGGVSQAGFRDATVSGRTYSASTLQNMIEDGRETDPSGGANSRFRNKGLRNKYFVYFFAGKYPDDEPVPDTLENSQPWAGGANYTKPNFDNTLTFLYLENPARYGVPYNFTPTDRVMNNQVILAKPQTDTSGAVPTMPYSLQSYRINGTNISAENRANPYYFTNPQNYTLIPGWPAPPGSMNVDPNANAGERKVWMTTVRDHVNAGTFKPSIQYHPRVVDQRTFRLTNGSFMKLIVGVKFWPHEHAVAGPKKNDNFREFWLVSFKARLEDD